MENQNSDLEKRKKKKNLSSTEEKRGKEKDPSSTGEKREKEDDLSSMKEKKGKRKKCGILDELRCQRADRKKNWRCPNMRANHIYCHHHMDLAAQNYERRKFRKKKVLTNASENPNEATNESLPSDADPAIVVSENAADNMCSRRSAEKAEEMSDHKDFLPTVIIEGWNKILTPAERHSFGCLLPECIKDDSALMSIFCGGTSRFEIDLAGDFCKSVAEANENIDEVLERKMESYAEEARELKALNSKYLKNVEEYHKGFVENVEWAKAVWSDMCNKDDAKFDKLVRENRSRFE